MICAVSLVFCCILFLKTSASGTNDGFLSKELHAVNSTDSKMADIVRPSDYDSALGTHQAPNPYRRDNRTFDCCDHTAYHHVVPHTSLIKMFSYNIEGLWTELDGKPVWQHLQKATKNWANRKPFPDEDAVLMKKGKINSYSELPKTVRTLLEWTPGNLVLGPRPQCRADDPGAEFDNDLGIFMTNEHKQLLFEVYQWTQKGKELNRKGWEEIVKTFSYTNVVITKAGWWDQISSNPCKLMPVVHLDS
eukprot:Platyproteum_vivax@DN3192_c0_g1_i1.p1